MSYEDFFCCRVWINTGVLLLILWGVSTVSLAR